ncbi:MAG: hypothetical protein Q9195_008961 [Heterodermia aff. obscurata]
MATLNTQLPLNTGAKIPAVGFGTWQDADAQEGAVLEALKAGYTHIDTARMQVPHLVPPFVIPPDRTNVFLATALNPPHRPSDVEVAVDASLKDLDTDYIDLYLMHWPSAFKPGGALIPKGDDGKIQTDNENVDFVDTWKALEKTFKSGKCRAIGVSNFSKAELERLLKETEVVPAAHQIECHPWLQQNAFTEWHKEKGIHVQQYSPFGNQNEIYSAGQNIGKLIEDPTLIEIGKKYGKNGAQVALAWGIQSGHSVLPKSKTPSRIKDNLDGDFELGKEDLEKIASIDKKLRFNDPSKNFGWDFFTDLEGKK